MEKTEKSSLTGLEAAYPMEEIRKPRPISSCMIFVLASIGVVSLGFLAAYAVLSVESTPPTVSEEINYQEPAEAHFLPRNGGGRLRPVNQDEYNRMMYPMEQPTSGASSPPSSHSITIHINKKNDSTDIDEGHSKLGDILSSMESMMSHVLSSLRRSEGPRIQGRLADSPFVSNPFSERISPASSETSGPFGPISKMLSDMSSLAPPSPSKSFKVFLFRKPQEENRESPIGDQLRSLLQRHEMERAQSPPPTIRMFRILSPGSLFGPGSTESDSKSEDDGPLFRSPFMSGLPSIFRQFPPNFFPFSSHSSEEEESPEGCDIKEKPDTGTSPSSPSSPDMKPKEKPTTDDNPREKVNEKQIPGLTSEPIAVNPSATEKMKTIEEAESALKGEEMAPISVKRDTDLGTEAQSKALLHLPSLIQV